MNSNAVTVVPSSYPALEAEAYLACECAEERQTGVDNLAPPTRPAANNAERVGFAWAEALLAQARPCAGDAARFVAGL